MSTWEVNIGDYLRMDLISGLCESVDLKYGSKRGQ